jgi:hypothetical protein
MTIADAWHAALSPRNKASIAPAISVTKYRAGAMRHTYVWLMLVLGIWIAAFFLVRMFALGTGGSSLPWDASWYAKISRDGYSFNGDPSIQQTVAFLPLYPMVLRALATTGIDLALLIPTASALFAFFGAIFLFLALQRLQGARIALAVLALFVASPFSIYFLNGYSESLYLLLMGLFFYALTCRESRYGAALAAGVASAIRPHAVVLWIVYVVWELMRAPRSYGVALRRVFAVTPLFFSGLLATEIFFYARFGDLGLYGNIMGAWGFDPIISGPVALTNRAYLQAVNLLDISPSLIFFSAPQLSKAILVSFVIMALCLVKRIPLIIGTYGLSLALFCVVATEGPQNLGRHLCSNIALPTLLVYVLAAKLLPKSEVNSEGGTTEGAAAFWAAIVALFAGSLVLQTSLLWRFYHGVWVS